MKYTAHPQGKRDNLPLISIFNEKGECVATLTMDDIALLYNFFMWNEADCLPDEEYHEAIVGLANKLQEGEER